MKRILIFFLVILTSSFLIFFWWYTATQPPQKDRSLHPFIIARGMSATEIGEKLEKERFIHSSLTFRIYVQLRDEADKIQAGDYRLAKNLTLPALVHELVRGPIALWITLPEGLRKEEVAIKVVDGLGLTGAPKEKFLREFLELSQNSEGYLFPDTYLFFKNASPSAVVTRMARTFDSRVDESITNQAQKQNLTLKELIILASIVERETKTEEERPVVAGILLKRLRAGWPLQADATLQYAVANEQCTINNLQCNWWGPVKKEDRKIRSPYNTYKRTGLPPTPIANPGLSSIKAVAAPLDSPYWFYLHDKEGNVHYAKTSEEHEENIRKYLQ